MIRVPQLQSRIELGVFILACSIGCCGCSTSNDKYVRRLSTPRVVVRAGYLDTRSLVTSLERMTGRTVIAECTLPQFVETVDSEFDFGDSQGYVRTVLDIAGFDLLLDQAANIYIIRKSEYYPPLGIRDSMPSKLR